MSDPIRHVVVLLLENRSFDQMLGSLQAVYPDLDGVDSCHSRFNTDSSGNIYRQLPALETQTRFDPKHEHADVEMQVAGGNAGFIRSFVKAYPASSQRHREEIMGYYPLDFLPGLHTLARNFTVCDRWFSSVPGPTWPNRFFALSGTSTGHINMPSSFELTALLEYFEQWQDTIFDRLREACRSWRVYYHDFPTSWLLLRQLLPENVQNYCSIDRFFTDTHDESSFPEFAFIEPKYFGHDQNDDHPPHNVMKGEKLIADVYNAIRANPELWNSTLLAVYFDEHGGFYDHVPPPATIAPDDHQTEFAFDRLGLRVPAILISPWVSRGVEHTVFDHTSLLRYLIDKWDLDPLGSRTSQANSIAVALREASPRSDTVPFIHLPYASLVPSHPEWEKNASNANQAGLHAFARFLEVQTGDVRFENMQEPPGRWSRLSTTIGKVLLKAGNSLMQSAQNEVTLRITRLDVLAKRIAAGEVRLSSILK